MGAAALLVQILVPFILAFDIKALSADAEAHTRHAAAVSHLRAPHADAAGNQAGGTASHAAHPHVGCPLCLALHAANFALADAAPRLPDSAPLRQRAADADVAALRPLPCPASYASRAPPALG